jgi:hypothetical protein
METFLLGLGAAAAYTGSLYLWPFRPCPRCKASGTNPGSNQHRHGTCRRCKGTRHVQRIGSRQVHKAVRAVIAYRRDREK